MEPEGRKEVTEQVIQAALIALLTGIINWSLERFKEKLKKKEESNK